jgi:glutaredoxin
MDVLILATENCNHRPQVEELLKKLEVSYEVKFIEQHPNLVQKYKVQSSPNIVVDNEIVFRGDCGRPLPTAGELKTMFSNRQL